MKRVKEKEANIEGYPESDKAQDKP